MRRRTGPFVSPGLPTQPCPHGIALDVLQRQPEVPRIQRTGIEPPLPQVPATFVEAVDGLCVAKVRPAHRLGQADSPIPKIQQNRQKVYVG